MKFWKKFSALLLLLLLGVNLYVPAAADGVSSASSELELCPRCGELAAGWEETWNSQWEVLSRFQCVHGNPDFNDRYEQQTGVQTITCSHCGWSRTTPLSRTRTFCPHLNSVVPTSVLLEP